MARIGTVNVAVKIDTEALEAMLLYHQECAESIRKAIATLTECNERNSGEDNDPEILGEN